MDPHCFLAYRLRSGLTATAIKCISSTITSAQSTPASGGAGRWAKQSRASREGREVHRGSRAVSPRRVRREPWQPVSQPRRACARMLNKIRLKNELPATSSDESAAAPRARRLPDLALSQFCRTAGQRDTERDVCALRVAIYSRVSTNGKNGSGGRGEQGPR